ncbi:MAG: hypothetical protein GY778_28860 [bacterium]|nr:hypothetical protein [bacterium]
MPVQQVPNDPAILTNTFFGMPVIEFGPELSTGGFGPYQLLGNIDSAALAKELETIALENSQGGARTTVLEIVTKLDPQMNVATFTLSAATLQYILGSANVTPVSADPVAAITDEEVVTTTDPEDFMNLAHQLLNSGSVAVDPAAIVEEQVGIGDGTSGDTSGDFTLDYKLFAVADVTSVTVTQGSTVTAYTPIATGAAAAGNEVEVEIGLTGISGDLQFFQGGVAVNVTGSIAADYQPSFVLTEGLAGGLDDYLMDLKNGRIQVHHEATKATGAQPLIATQPVFVDYTYDRLAHNLLAPFSQREFLGRARIRHLSDIGINIIWNVPSAQILIDDTDFAWNDEDFATGSLALKLLDDGSAEPYGEFEHYDRDQAGNSV